MLALVHRALDLIREVAQTTFMKGISAGRCRFLSVSRNANEPQRRVRRSSKLTQRPRSSTMHKLLAAARISSDVCVLREAHCIGVEVLLSHKRRARSPGR